MSSTRTIDRAQDETLGADESSTTTLGATLLARGEVIDRYVVLAKIGHGGMGVVYSAYDPELNRRVALKLLVPSHGDLPTGTGDGGRLLREARAMAQLTHPNVVTVYDAGTFEGAVFLAMEFLDGGTLGSRMRARPAWRTLVPWFIDAARGLAAAHAAGLVHRDFKPDNVLLTPEGVAKVSDFGLARVQTAVDQTLGSEWQPSQEVVVDNLTQAGAILGTPAYMAPEQHLGATADARSDQFSFCVALFEALHGERPFRGAAMAELVEAVTTGQIVEPANAGDVPSDLRRIVRRGLSTEPADRWPSMSALIDALTVDPSRRRTRRVAIAGVAVAAIAVGGGAYAIDHRQREACRSEGGALDAVWNDERREAIRSAMRATEVSFAEPTVQRVEALVDAWVERWSGARTAACLVALDDADDGAAALRRGCLDERRVHLEVVLDMFTDADRAIVTSAVQTAAGLPRIEPCDDVAWLRRQRRDGTADGGAETALAVARLAALTSTGGLRRALAMAHELVDETANEPARQAEVLRWRGLLEQETGDPAAAVASLRAAYFLAGRHHADRVAALAATDLTMLVGVRMRDFAEGRNWADNALMMAERDPDPELRLELLYAVGALETSSNDYESGIARFREQIELATSMYGPDHPETGYAHLALSNAYGQAGRLAEARHEIETAKQTWAAAFGATHPSVAAAIYNLGNVAFAEGRIAEAIAMHREAIAMREAVLPAGHGDTATSYSALGSAIAGAGDSAEALVHHRRAHDMFVALYGDDAPRAVGELANVAKDLLVLDRFDEAAPLVSRLCERAERSRADAPEPWVQCLALRAMLLAGQGRATEAASTAEAAMKAGVELYGATDTNVAPLVFSLGTLLVSAGDRERGCAEQRRALALWRENLGDDHPTVREHVADAARDCPR